MSCVKQGNVRCTDCCKAIHIPTVSARKIWGPKPSTITDGHTIRTSWSPVSYRRAKKRNPHISKYRHMSYFKCRHVTSQGCGIYEDRPDVCARYKGGSEYSPTCPTDINIIARENNY